jgi:hypothetical protein
LKGFKWETFFKDSLFPTPLLMPVPLSLILYGV